MAFGWLLGVFLVVQMVFKFFGGHKDKRSFTKVVFVFGGTSGGFWCFLFTECIV